MHSWWVHAATIQASETPAFDEALVSPCYCRIFEYKRLDLRMCMWCERKYIHRTERLNLCRHDEVISQLIRGRMHQGRASTHSAQCCSRNLAAILACCQNSLFANVIGSARERERARASKQARGTWSPFPSSIKFLFAKPSQPCAGNDQNQGVEKTKSQWHSGDISWLLQIRRLLFSHRQCFRS